MRSSRSNAASRPPVALVQLLRLPQLVAARVAQRLDPVTDRRIGMVAQPVRRLHDVGVGIVHHEPGRVVHHRASIPQPASVLSLAHTVVACATPTHRPPRRRCSCRHRRNGCGRSSATSTCPLASRASSPAREWLDEGGPCVGAQLQGQQRTSGDRLLGDDVGRHPLRAGTDLRMGGRRPRAPLGEVALRTRHRSTAACG